MTGRTFNRPDTTLAALPSRRVDVRAAGVDSIRRTRRWPLPSRRVDIHTTGVETILVTGEEQ